jgi:tetratricopeptide (TPR) repeat protein
MKKTEQKKYSRWFYLILILIPILFLLILELALQIFNYGPDRRQWIDVNENQITLNYYIAKKYFHSTENAPVVLSASFDKEKKNDAFRIFIMGESSAAGFPYLPNGSFSNYIEDRLKLIYPDIPIEVINCGITATNTYAWLDLIPGIIDQKPDLIILYGGHNEYYGALGAASTESFGSSRWINKFSLWLDNFKTTELVRNVIKWTVTIFKGKVDSKEKASTLMAQLAKGQYVVYESDLFKKGIAQFEENLREILIQSKENNIPVILSMLVSNLKDQQPFISKQVGAIPSSQKYYELAQRKLKEGYIKEADSLFRLAKDLDLLKFRAPEAFNSVIKKLAEEFNFPVADMDSLFTSESSSKIIGDDLMTDHLHPTLKGYQHMGKKFFKVMEGKKFLPKIKPIDISDAKQDSIVLANFNFSKLDTLIALHRIAILKNDWPYVTERIQQTPIMLSDFTDSLAYFVAEGRLGWGDSHRLLARDFFKNKDLLNYKKEMGILINSFPNTLEYYDNLNEVLINNKNYSEAYPILMKRYRKSPNAFTTKWLGFINFMNRKYNEAIKYFEQSIKFTNDDPDVYFYLTGAYGKEAMFEKALRSIQKCLEFSPDYPNGKAVLRLAENEVDKRK